MADSCERCDGQGFRYVRGGIQARAELCSCREQCATCRGRRFVVVARDGYEFADDCPDCEALRQRVVAYNQARIPGDYAQKHLGGYIASAGNQREVKGRALQFQKRFLPAESRGLLLVGRPGTGKTHILCSMLHVWTIQNGFRARYIDFPHLLAEIRATFGSRRDETQEDILGPLVEVPILVVDELGNGVRTEWGVSIFDELVSRRYNAGRVVLGATNFLPAQELDRAGGGSLGSSRESLEDRIGVRVWSRLREMCELVRLSDEIGDYRMRG